jgi:hypothetical protein
MAVSGTGMCRQTGKGPYRHQTANWKASLAVAMGDLVYMDSITPDSNAAGQYYDKSAAIGTNFGAGTHSQAQVAFKTVFRGVSDCRRTTLQATDGSDTTDGPILATGEYTFPCTALGSAAEVGAFVGPAQGTGGAQTLAAAQVEIVVSVSNAIGKLTRFAAVGATYLTFEIMPVTFDGGVQAQA